MKHLDDAEDLREKNTSVVKMSGDKNDTNLSSDWRPRRKALTKTINCLKDTLDYDYLNEKKSLTVGSM